MATNYVLIVTTMTITVVTVIVISLLLLLLLLSDTGVTSVNIDNSASKRLKSTSKLTKLKSLVVVKTRDFWFENCSIVILFAPHASLLY